MPTHFRSSISKMYRKLEDKNKGDLNQSQPIVNEFQPPPLTVFSSSADINERLIQIEVTNPQGRSVYFKIRESTKMERLINTYCSRENINPHNFVFLYQGIKLEPLQTPLTLNMKDKDIIDLIFEKDYNAHFLKGNPSQTCTSLNSSSFNPSLTNNEIETSGDNIVYKKNTARKKKVIRFENVIRSGKIAYVTQCYGVNNDNNSFEKQCEFALNDLVEKLAKVGLKKDEVGRIRVYLLDLSLYPLFLSIVKNFFGDAQPIVTAVQVVKLLNPDAEIELEADATKKTKKS